MRQPITKHYPSSFSNYTPHSRSATWLDSALTFGVPPFEVFQGYVLLKGVNPHMQQELTHPHREPDSNPRCQSLNRLRPPHDKDKASAFGNSSVTPGAGQLFSRQEATSEHQQPSDPPRLTPFMGLPTDCHVLTRKIRLHSSDSSRVHTPRYYPKTRL